MDGNSQKTDAYTVSCALALAALRDWLRQEGGNQKIPLVLDILAGKTESALGREDAMPAVDPDTLRDIYYATRGGSSGTIPAGRWLSRRVVSNWWSERQRQIEQACRASGADCAVSLVVSEGGGRGNPTTYRLAFVPVDSDEVIADGEETASVDPSIIRYDIEPAKAALWLRLLIGSERFRMRSWRGSVLMALVAGPIALVVLYWIIVIKTINAPRPLMAMDIAELIVASILTVAIAKGVRPLFRLAHERITIATDFFLALSQMHAQFRLSRDSSSKLKGGWFSVVRHSGNCPICSAEVELHNGGAAFPDRIIGRCNDSPMEHVFSFDPVSLSGRLLR